MMDKISL